MTDGELREKELQLKRETLAFEKAKWKSEREFERKKWDRESKFLYRNSTTIITAAVSVAAVVVSVAQIVSAVISRRAEMDNARVQREIAAEAAKRDFDLRWKAEAMRFVSENKNEIFKRETGEQSDKLALCGVISTTFPQEMADTLFVKFGGSAPEEQTFWGDCRKQLDRIYAASVTEKVDEPSGVRSITVGEVDKNSIKESVERLYGPDRQAASKTLAEWAKGDQAAVVEALVDGILPENAQNSYRKNLYIALTLARIDGGWRGSNNQIGRVKGLQDPDSNNYRDPTYRGRVDAAVDNYKGK